MDNKLLWVVSKTVISDKTDINVIKDLLEDVFGQIKADIKSWLQENESKY